MSQELQMQMRLLVAFHGRQQVLEELANAEGVDVAVVEREIQQIRESAKIKTAPKKRTRRRKTARELIQDAAPSDIVYSLVERLAMAYEEKGFLGELWHVRQFLESQAVTASKIRSRADAFPKVVHVLSRLQCDELEKLVVQTESQKDDLSILTDQILGPATPRSDGARRRQSVG